MKDSNPSPPDGVPPDVAQYLEDAVRRLSDVIDEYKLKLVPYEHHAPESKVWQHSFYATYMGRRVCLRIVTEKTSAQALATRIVCFLRNYASPNSNDWITYGSWPAKGLDYLVKTFSELALHFREMCGRMPIPTRPDAKA